MIGRKVAVVSALLVLTALAGCGFTPAREGLDESLLSVPVRFVLGANLQMSDGDIGNSEEVYTVPEGMNLVLEYASLETAANPSPPDAGAAYMGILSTHSAQFASASSLVLGVVTPVTSSTGTSGGITTFWEQGKVIKILAGPGERIRIGAQRNYDVGNLTIVIELVAYLQPAS